MMSYIMKKDEKLKNAIEAMSEYFEFEINNYVDTYAPTQHTKRIKYYIEDNIEKYINNALTVDFYIYLGKAMNEYFHSI